VKKTKHSSKNKRRDYRDGFTRRGMPFRADGWALTGLFAYSLQPSILDRGLADTSAFSSADLAAEAGHEANLFLYRCKLCGTERLILRIDDGSGWPSLIAYESPNTDQWTECSVPRAILNAHCAKEFELIWTDVAEACFSCE
jgi:hypothetical protein